MSRRYVGVLVLGLLIPIVALAALLFLGVISPSAILPWPAFLTTLFFAIVTLTVFRAVDVTRGWPI
jgi:hypothetical protein